MPEVSHDNSNRYRDQLSYCHWKDSLIKLPEPTVAMVEFYELRTHEHIDRYELTMQVPVQIDSATSGHTVGEPKFYLNEIASVAISPTGEISVSFARNLDFDAKEWEQVYDGRGDFGKIGFAVNATSVANFQKYADASRPSN